MDKTDAFIPRKRFRWNKMECWWALGVATGEEAWELRLVMKSENVRENRRFPGKLYFLTNLSGLKRFPANKLYFHNDLSVNMRLFPDKLI